MTAINVSADLMQRSCAVQWFGAWHMHPTALAEMERLVASVDLPSYISAHAAEVHDAEMPKLEKIGRVAVIDIKGTITKGRHSLMGVTGGTATTDVSYQLHQALADPDVGSIFMRIDSPGGTVAGTGDLGDEIRAAREKKPIVAFIEDLGASAAYWLASQANEIFASRHAQVGSIGVIASVIDSSKAAEAHGYRVIVIASGPRKGDFAQGVPVTDDMIKAGQARIDQMHGIFVDAVAQGRKLKESAVREAATGELFGASRALDLGLVDKLSDVRGALRRAMELAGHTPIASSMRAATADVPAIRSWTASTGTGTMITGTIIANGAENAIETPAPTAQTSDGDRKEPSYIPAGESGDEDPMSDVKVAEIERALAEQRALIEKQGQELAAFQKAQGEREAKAASERLAAARAKLVELGATEEEAALFPTPESAEAAAKFQRGARPATTLPVGRKAPASDEALPAEFDVAAEYAKSGNPNVMRRVN